jgi:hypothetical protein
LYLCIELVGLRARCHEGQALDVGVRVSSVQQGEVAGFARAISERKAGGLSGLNASLAAICAGARPGVELARFTGLSILYSLVDEAFHWRRYVSPHSDRVEMWSHVSILLGHTARAESGHSNLSL